MTIEAHRSVPFSEVTLLSLVFVLLFASTTFAYKLSYSLGQGSTLTQESETIPVFDFGANACTTQSILLDKKVALTSVFSGMAILADTANSNCRVPSNDSACFEMDLLGLDLTLPGNLLIPGNPAGGFCIDQSAIGLEGVPLLPNSLSTIPNEPETIGKWVSLFDKLTIDSPVTGCPSGYLGISTSPTSTVSVHIQGNLDDVVSTPDYPFFCSFTGNFSLDATANFATIAPVLVDPVSDGVLLDDIREIGSGQGNVASLASDLATRGIAVTGAGADGVTEVLVRIPAVTVGQQLSLALINDHSPPTLSSSSDEDGALGNVGDSSFSSNNVTVTSVQVGSQAFAFAIYRAPADFPRLNRADDDRATRSVTLRATSPGEGEADTPILILRPPVLLIHGIWDNASLWKNFAPLYSNFGHGPGNDSRFYVKPLAYSSPISIQNPIPAYTPKQLATARTNSLGFAYNAEIIFRQIQNQLSNFKGGANPGNISLAALQADIVAHSMGGDITRSLALRADFYGNELYGKGNVHKLITIDTPHFGTPLAEQLLPRSSSGQDQNSCVRKLLADHGNIAFNSVTLNGVSVSGAVSDLSGDGTLNGYLSPALMALEATAPHPIPTALIAGTMDTGNLTGLTLSPHSIAIRLVCGTILQNPLALNLTQDSWTASIFGQDNDGIVPLSSQLGGFSTFTVFQGFIHSTGTALLGFNGPIITNSSTVSQNVIDLLNTPVNQTPFQLATP